MIIFFCWVWNFLEPYFNMIIEMKNKYNWEAWEKEKKKKKSSAHVFATFPVNTIRWHECLIGKWCFG